MKKSEVYIHLTDIFRDVFDDDSITINDNTLNMTSYDIEDWDSITHITLMDAVESAFHVKFKMREVTHLKNVGELVKILIERA